jgi:hypothetical protein
MAKKSKKLKIPEGTPPDTSRDGTQKGQLLKGGKELKIDKLLEKKKEVKEKDVFDFSGRKNN